MLIPDRGREQQMRTANCAESQVGLRLHCSQMIKNGFKELFYMKVADYIRVHVIK